MLNSNGNHVAKDNKSLWAVCMALTQLYFLISREQIESVALNKIFLLFFPSSQLLGCKNGQVFSFLSTPCGRNTRWYKPNQAYNTETCLAFYMIKNRKWIENWELIRKKRNNVYILYMGGSKLVISSLGYLGSQNITKVTQNLKTIEMHKELKTKQKWDHQVWNNRKSTEVKDLWEQNEFGIINQTYNAQ